MALKSYFIQKEKIIGKFLMHDFKNVSAAGHGKWRQCLDCGTTKHNGFWWLGGYKSKEEPLCSVSFESVFLREWKSKAIKLDDAKQ